MNENYGQLDGEEKNTFYVYLPNHPGRGVPGVVSSSFRLRDLFLELGRVDLLEMFSDTEIVLDRGEDGKLIGIEILA